MIPPLKERLNRAVDFAHSRSESPLTSREIADQVSATLQDEISEQLIRELRDGTINAVPVGLVEPLAQVFGIRDHGYFADPVAAADIDRVLVMHERLALLIEARDLGVQHIATRDVDQDPRLVHKLRAALAAMTKRPQASSD
ncbi:hypothetical protein [Gordonia rhizosphera]|uniref:Uncharacterized protein n=1 Tax=Gordonia rhizosphera NBRC 16068 TaxID=1108045 RepID=K6VMK6_9ACTN|nr:hypothetical protein GORHZ_006_00040 [Gordonia rhizosphera NBRC 16068]